MADPTIIGDRPPKEVFQADRIRYRVTPTGPSGGLFTAADGWDLSVAFVTVNDSALSGDLQTILTISDAVSEVADSPGTWEVDLDSSGAPSPSTQAWQVGLYHWQEFMEKAAAADRVTVRTGLMNLKQSYGSGALSATGGDFRTWARIALENVEAVLQNKASKDQLSYSIAGRSLQRFTPSELMEFRSTLQWYVQREDDLEDAANIGADEAGRYLVEW